MSRDAQASRIREEVLPLARPSWPLAVRENPQPTPAAAIGSQRKRCNAHVTVRCCSSTMAISFWVGGNRDPGNETERTRFLRSAPLAGAHRWRLSRMALEGASRTDRPGAILPQPRRRTGVRGGLHRSVTTAGFPEYGRRETRPDLDRRAAGQPVLRATPALGRA